MAWKSWTEVIPRKNPTKIKVKYDNKIYKAQHHIRSLWQSPISHFGKGCVSILHGSSWISFRKMTKVSENWTHSEFTDLDELMAFSGEFLSKCTTPWEPRMNLYLKERSGLAEIFQANIKHWLLTPSILSSLPPAQAHGWSKTNNIKPCRCKSWTSVILTAKLPLTQIHSKTLKIQHIPHHFPCLLLQICNLCLSKARLFHLCPGFQRPCYHSVEDRRRWLSVVGKTWKNYHYKWLPSSSPRGCLVALSQWLLNVPPAHQCSFLDLFIEKTTRSIFKSSMVFEQGIEMASNGISMSTTPSSVEFRHISSPFARALLLSTGDAELLLPPQA